VATGTGIRATTVGVATAVKAKSAVSGVQLMPSSFQPAPNVSLQLGFGYTQQGGRLDSDTPSPSLSTESPYALVGHK